MKLASRALMENIFFIALIAVQIPIYRKQLLQVSLIVHLFVENTIYAYRTVIPLFVEDNVMPDLETKEPGLYDIV